MKRLSKINRVHKARSPPGSRAERWALHRLIIAAKALSRCPRGPDGSFRQTAMFAQKWADFVEAGRRYHATRAAVRAVLAVPARLLAAQAGASKVAA